MSVFTSTIGNEARATFLAMAREAGWEDINIWIANDQRKLSINMTLPLERMMDRVAHGQGLPPLPTPTQRTKMVGRYRMRTTTRYFR
jgi:hypothetical protein